MKKAYFQSFIQFQFYVSSYVWCVFHCSNRKSRVRDFLWKLLSFHHVSYWNDFSIIPLRKFARGFAKQNRWGRSHTNQKPSLDKRLTWTQLFFFRNASRSTEININEVKTQWVLVGASNSGHSMIAYLLRQLTKSNILWFVLDLWPLKILAPIWTQFFFQKCKQQYWHKLNEVKTPWVLVGAGCSKHIRSAYRTAWTFIWSLIYCALALRKCFENY